MGSAMADPLSARYMKKAAHWAAFFMTEIGRFPTAAK